MCRLVFHGSVKTSEKCRCPFGIIHVFAPGGSNGVGFGLTPGIPHDIMRPNAALLNTSAISCRMPAGFFYGRRIVMADRMKAKVVSPSPDACFHQRVVSFFQGDFLSSLNSPEYVVFPGFCDVHVHFREPGFSYKETIASGCAAAARGGYTDVCTMPNLDPVPDSREHLQIQQEIINKTA